MTFPRYPKYKDSGVEWLREVPEHWSANPIKRLGALKGGAGFPHEDQGVEGEEFPFFKVSALAHADQFGVLATPEDSVSRKTAARLGAYIFPSHTVVLAKVGAALLLGRIRIIGREACVDNNMVGIVPFDSTHPSFLRYSFSLVRFDAIANPGAVPSLSAADLGSFPLPQPPLAEQRYIADFLDGETARIDALIAEQRRLMELLKEKRQAVIFHAVTKGLNPDAPMKDSGIEWLGEVPAHWGVKRVKWIARMESGHTPDKKIPEYWEDGDIPWISLNDTGYLKDNDYISDTAYMITALGVANSSARLLPAGTVVFSRDATIGRCAITTRPMAVSQHFIAWICGAEVLPQYLLFRFRSMTQELERLTTGATLKTIGMPDVRTIVCPVPAMSEQQAIVTHISRATTMIDELIYQAQRAIDLLLERRAALISAAVTGQIDVRNAA